MSDFSIKPGSTARLSTGAPRSANTDALSKKPPPFTRPAEVDGGRFSNFGHNLANGTRRLFGRPQQPSAAQEMNKAWRQTPAFARTAQWVQAHAQVQMQQPAPAHLPPSNAFAVHQAAPVQGRPVYMQVNHEATQAAVGESWRQWRVDNPGVSHQVGNQAGVLATYF